MRYLTVLWADKDQCGGCRLCELACSLRHEGECAAEKARIRIMKRDDWGLDLPVYCRQCYKPKCVADCPTGALTKNKVTGIVEINEEECIGCFECVAACPFGAIFIHPEKKTIVKCDLCGGSDPECVKICPLGALRLVRLEDLGKHKRELLLTKAAFRLKNQDNQEDCI